MLNKDVLGKLPRNFRYKDAWWYKELQESAILQKRRIIAFSYFAGMLILCSLSVIDFIRGESSAAFHDIIALIIFTAVAVFFLLLISSLIRGGFFPESSLLGKAAGKGRMSIEAVSCATMLAGLGVFLFSVYLPISSWIALLPIVIFIPYAFLLNGSGKGIAWSVVFVAIAVCAYIFSFFGFLPPWPNPLSLSFLVMAAAGIVVVLVLMYLGERQQERLFGRLVCNLLIDRTTGLPNKEVLTGSYPEKDTFLLVIVHIRNFRELSSIFGYDVSEKILQSVSMAVTEISSRDGYLCFKLGGCDFGVLIPLDSESADIETAERLLNLLWFELQSYSITEQGREITPVYIVSAALASVYDKDTVIARADTALNLAEIFHRNVFVYRDCYDDRNHFLKASIDYTILLENLRYNKLKALYQPVVNTQTCEVIAYESLLRIQRQDGTLDSVYGYLNVARDTGLYHTLTRFMLQNAYNALMQTDKNISVNITPGDIAHPEFVEEAFKICKAVSGCKGKIVFELLESEELTDLDACRQFIRTVQSYGCRIAIDDFGSGYSNFCNILNLSVDIVKIDGSLMRSIETDGNARAMVESIASFCNKADKIIVAEFIENENMHRIAKEIGIHCCQGYYFGKPGELDI